MKFTEDRDAACHTPKPPLVLLITALTSCDDHRLEVTLRLLFFPTTSLVAVRKAPARCLVTVRKDIAQPVAVTLLTQRSQSGEAPRWRLQLSLPPRSLKSTVPADRRVAWLGALCGVESSVRDCVFTQPASRAE